MIGFIVTGLGLKSENTLLDLLQKHKFERWLKRKEPTDTVGFAISLNRCPIATYLKSKHHYHGVLVLSSGIKAFKRKKTDVLHEDEVPQWVISFIKAVDGSEERELMTASKALEILKSCHE